MLKHLPFEFLKLQGRLDSELLVERLPGAAVELERVGLPARTVEREHQLGARAFAERHPRDELLELRYQARVPAEREVSLDPFLERGEAGVFEPGSSVASEWFGLELDKGWSAPELKRLAQPLRRRLRIAGDEQSVSFPP